MAKQNQTNGETKPRLSNVPVYFPTVRVVQPDGSVLLRAGKAVVNGHDCSAKEAASFLGLSIRTVSYQCEVGLFKTAYKPGGRPRSPWRISWEEVYARKNPSPE